jgi:hypothetical protein
MKLGGEQSIRSPEKRVLTLSTVYNILLSKELFMSPKLEKVVINGASRHSLSKGYLLVDAENCLVDSQVSEKVLLSARQGLAERATFTGFTINYTPTSAYPAVLTHPAVLYITTPFLPVYTVKQRNAFIQRVVNATMCLQQAAAKFHCHLVASGVNPYHDDSEDTPRALCADLHQVEVYDEGEVERIYNLYRQFLPEILAVSAHASVYGGVVQKDSSLRMSVNPSSFLPRYISQFSGLHLERLEHQMRKSGLGDLRQMDINPLGGNTNISRHTYEPLLTNSVAAIELRFIDAQCSFPFIRAEILLLQAIAMYGRFLARKGKRLPAMHDEVIDENKVLALQKGGGAIFQPDKEFKKNDGKRGYSFHDQGSPEVATTALLMVIEGLLLPRLQDLECEPWEIIPLILGAELRRLGKRSFANYAEYQQYLCNALQGRFVPLLQQQMVQLLSSSRFDIISDYNRQLYQELTQDIEKRWSEKLTRPVRSS